MHSLMPCHHCEWVIFTNISLPLNIYDLSLKKQYICIQNSSQLSILQIAQYRLIIQRLLQITMNSYTYLFKTIIIGDPSVGKSCLLKPFLEHRFKLNTETTIGVQFGSKIVDSGQHKIKMQIWDTAGQEVFKSITRSYYRGSVAAILMYDITSRQSFKDTAKWLQQTRNYANQKISLLLVGNKCDLQQKREVSTQEGSTFAESNKMIFMECSAKDHQLTQEAFLRLAKEVLRKIEHHQIDPKNQQHGIKLGNMGKTNKKQAIRLCCFW